MKNKTIKTISVNDFSHHIFWDVDKDQVDLERNKRFIIQRVLEYGLMNDWKLIKGYYGIMTIGKEMQKVRSLDPVSLSFVSTITGIGKENFRCYTMRQFLPRHWNF
ncbi:MAG: hypothetical protein PF692_11975 [Kiritimatiellae bacterium]|jgi:hypothetical protein|nr:hypothetical protein [Kiritimatiellia bacterium]